MFKRVTIVTLVVAAFVLMLAVPALAFNGYRGDYTVKEGCACHVTSIGSVPPITPVWEGSKHAEAGVDNQATRLPYGSVCAGCHTSNFDPTKVVPTPTATAANGNVSWGASNGIPDPLTQSTGEFASSENFVGCSSCHYGTSALGPIFGEDSNDTTHTAPYGQLANADICGACHSRYSYTVDEFAVMDVPYTKVTTPIPGTPITPNPNPTTAIQPQMAIGYPMLGAPGTSGWDPAAPLSDYLNIPMTGWTPTPTATDAAGLMTYWKDSEGSDMLWQQVGHDGSAAQYPEWANEGHAMALTALTSQPFWASFPEATKQQCLECHSADFRIMKEAGKSVTSADVQYGITCVGCHTPHEAGTTKGKWDEEFDAQLIGDPKNSSNLCITCHNGELPVGQEATPGTEIHHPMKEMMAGYGAIGVPEIPSVHEGKCVQCHMPPTSYSRGSVQLGGNHTFTIIKPEVAAESSPIPVRTTTPSPGATPVVTMGQMPYSACTTCHGGQAPDDPYATYLQGTIEQRQSWTKAKIEQIWNELDKAAVNLGYADADAAQAALVAMPESDWSNAQQLFLSSFTNVEFVDSEGSYGIHNWAYSVRIVNTAMAQAKSVTAEPRKYVVTLNRVAKYRHVKRNARVPFKGGVQTGFGLAAQGKVTLQIKKKGGAWKNWTKVTLKTNGTYSKTLRMKNKGTWYVKTKMPGDGALNKTGYSRYWKIIVK